MSRHPFSRKIQGEPYVKEQRPLFRPILFAAILALAFPCLLHAAGKPSAPTPYTCPGCDLHNQNLEGRDLRGANLVNADLSRTRLDGANLSNANLSGANLSEVQASGALFINANLQGAHLTLGNFYKANFSGANILGATRTNANFTRAIWVNGQTCGSLSLNVCKGVE